MAASHVLTALTAKREEIETYIRRIERQLAAARHDLAHVNATIRLFEMNSEHAQFPVYVQSSRHRPRRSAPPASAGLLFRKPDSG